MIGGHSLLGISDSNQHNYMSKNTLGLDPAEAYCLCTGAVITKGPYVLPTLL